MDDVGRLDRVHVSACSQSKVGLVLGAAQPAVDVEACLTHPPTLKHDDGVGDSSCVEHGGQAGPVAVPRVESGHAGTVEPSDHRLEHGVEHRVAVGAPMGVGEEGGRVARSAWDAELDISQRIARIVDAACQDEKDGEGAMDLAPLVGLRARWRDRAAVAPWRHATELGSGGVGEPQTINAPDDGGASKVYDLARGVACDFANAEGSADQEEAEPQEDEDQMVVVRPGIGPHPPAVSRDAVNFLHECPSHGLCSFRGERMRAMVADVEPHHAVHFSDELLVARHSNPPATKDPNDGEWVSQRRSGLDELPA
eukprot:7388721-Prymnesium_polylepis.1